MSDFRNVALLLAERAGWSCFPTKLNPAGQPKLPSLRRLSDFTRLRPGQNGDHDWDGAAGIAVALGEPSGGLGLIDIDHVGLAGYVWSCFRKLEQAPLTAKSPRGLHVFTDGTPSLPRDYSARYPGLAASKRCLVQLLSSGCYAVLPPTPGYSWLTRSVEPAYGSTDEVWRRLALAHAMPYERARTFHFTPRERSASPRLSTREIREALDVGR